MNRWLYILLLVLSAGSVSAQPDLDRYIQVLSTPYPPVDSLDRFAYNLRYFNENKPTAEQREKVMTLQKLIAKGYAANFHFKQGYEVFEKYISFKEQKLSEAKADTMQKINVHYSNMDAKDATEEDNLRNNAQQLDNDITSLNSRASIFKKVFSAIIAVLSLMFAVSLFKTGVRLKEMRDVVQENRNKLLDNHRLSLLGSLANNVRQSVQANYSRQSELSKELIGMLPEDKAQPIREELKPLASS